MLALAALLSAGTVVAATPAQAGNGECCLWTDQRLYGGNYGTQSLVSPDGRFIMYMGNNCNVAVYDGPYWTGWATNTYGWAGWYCIWVVQTDGNLVLYRTATASGSPWYWAWDAATQGNAGAYLVMQNDGNLVLYAPYHNPYDPYATRALWSSWYGRAY